MDLSVTLNSIYTWFYRNRWSLLLPFFAGLIVHFQLYANALTNPDGVLAGTEFASADWELSLGRWGLTYVERMYNHLVSPMLTSSFLILAFSLAGNMLSDLFFIKKSIIRTLLVLFIICSPFAAINITYYFCAIAYSLAFCLAVLSVFCVAQFRTMWHGVLFGALVLSFSIGCYQSNLGVAAVAAVMHIFIFAINAQNNKQIISRIGGMLIMGLSGTVIYYIVLKVLLYTHNLTLASYKGAENIGIAYIIQNFVNSAKDAYIDFYQFFCQSAIVINTQELKVLFVVILVCLLLGFLWILFVTKNNFLRIVMALCLFVIPFAANIIDVVAPDTRVVLLTAGGMCLVAPFCIALLWLLVEKKFSIYLNFNVIGKVFVFLLAVGVIWQFTLINTADAVVLQRTQNETLALANRIYHSLEANPDFSPGNSFYVIGVPDKGNYPQHRLMYSDINGYVYWGMLWSDGLSSARCWQSLFYQHLGVNMFDNQGFTEAINNITAIIDSEQFKNMPIYPNSGSIQLLDDVLVVKVSDV